MTRWAGDRRKAHPARRLVAGCATAALLAWGACSRPNAPPPTAPTCSPEPPASSALGDWLRAECYARWPSEPAVHASSMNPSGIRIFLSPALAASVSGGQEAHPVGAAAVREIYGPDHAQRVGWSASIKTADGWFWYEEFTRHGRATVAQREAPGCTGCHDGGRDRVQTTRLAAQ